MLCLSLFLRGTRQWFITNMQGYLTLHLYGIVCPSGSKAFTDFKGCVFGWYSSAMLTPSENLILSQFPFCLCILTWHTVILQMQNCPPKKPNSSTICSWMTSLTSTFKAAEAPVLLFCRSSYSFTYLYWNALFESRLAADMNYFVQQPCIYCYLPCVNPRGMFHAFYDGLFCTS